TDSERSGTSLISQLFASPPSHELAAAERRLFEATAKTADVSFTALALSAVNNSNTTTTASPSAGLMPFITSPLLSSLSSSFSSPPSAVAPIEVEVDSNLQIVLQPLLDVCLLPLKLASHPHLFLPSLRSR